MLYLFFACVAIGMILLGVFLKLRVSGDRKKAVFVKALVSVFFLLTLMTASLAAGDNADWKYTSLLAGGLLLGLLGDIWLDFKYIYTQDSDFWTFSGFFVFMFGHFFYFAAVLYKHGVVHPLAVIFAAVSAVATVIVLLVLEKPTKMHYGKFKAITLVYGAILVSMFALCLNTALFDGHGNAGILLMTVGGGLFIVSDLILSGTYFGTGKNRPVDIITNHTTYYLAQYCIAASALLVNVEF